MASLFFWGGQVVLQGLEGGPVRLVVGGTHHLGGQLILGAGVLLGGQHLAEHPHHPLVHRAHGLVVQAAPQVEGFHLLPLLGGEVLGHALLHGFLLGGHGAGEEQRHPLARQSGQPLFQPGQLAHTPRVDTGAKGHGVIAGEIHPGGLLQGETIRGKVLRQPLGIALGKACFRGVHHQQSHGHYPLSLSSILAQVPSGVKLRACKVKFPLDKGQGPGYYSIVVSCLTN